MKRSLVKLFVICCIHQVTAQKIIKTNVLFPMHFVKGNGGGGLEIALDMRVATRLQISNAINLNSMLLQNTVTDGPVHGDVRIESKLKFQKAGIRTAFKFYVSGDEQTSVLTGFNHGPFIDISYVQRKSEYQINNSEHFSFQDASGIYLGAGYRIGYTFKTGNWIIEPNLGIGAGYPSKDVLYPRTTGFFDDNSGKNTQIIFSASHLQLHVGYIIGH